MAGLLWELVQIHAHAFSSLIKWTTAGVNSPDGSVGANPKYRTEFEERLNFTT
jgi:hypothetical protein